jgi:hypothetical protein
VYVRGKSAARRIKIDRVILSANPLETFLQHSFPHADRFESIGCLLQGLRASKAQNHHVHFIFTQSSNQNRSEPVTGRGLPNEHVRVGNGIGRMQRFGRHPSGATALRHRRRPRCVGTGHRENMKTGREKEYRYQRMFSSLLYTGPMSALNDWPWRIGLEASAPVLFDCIGAGPLLLPLRSQSACPSCRHVEVFEEHLLLWTHVASNHIRSCSDAAKGVGCVAWCVGCRNQCLCLALQ